MQWSKIKTLTLIICILPVVFLSGCTEKKSQALVPTEPLVLVDNGTCNVSIHNIADGIPSVVETYAAEELQAAFQLACGITPQINPDSPAAIEIRLGVANQFDVGVGDASQHAYAVRRTVDDHIELLGNCEAAVMWAVDDFCKEVLHVSWPIANDTMALEGEPQSTVAVKQLRKVESPDFRYRGWIFEKSTDGHMYVDFIGRWMAHNRQGTIYNSLPDLDSGGAYKNMVARGIEADTTLHNFVWLVPADEYYDDHPEYFPLIDGARLRPVGASYYAQLCISNPDVFDIVVQKIIQGFIDYPEIGVFGVAQSDGGGGWCQCDNCVAMDGAQAGTGVYSNRLIRFVNAIADKIVPDHPGKYIGTYAYGETKPAPDINVSDNVVITFCPGGRNYMRKLTDPCDPRNAAVMAYLNGWLDNAENVHFWEYYMFTGMDSCPTPYARTICEEFGELKALGLKGICSETNPPDWPSLRILSYTTARAGWDTSLKFDDILDDYCNEVYGPAASHMKSYHLLYESIIYKHVPVLPLYGAAAQLFPPAFSSADMAALDGYLTAAEAAGGSQANINAVADERKMFENFKSLWEDPADIPGIGPNLVTNPGAESDSDGWTNNTFMGKGDFSYSISSDVAHSGNKSFKTECTGSTGPAARWYQVEVPVTVGKKYVSRFWVRANGGAKGEIHLWMSGFHNPVGWVDSDDKWVRLVGPEITATGPTIGLYLNSSGPGTVYFDDIFIAELPEHIDFN